MKKIYLIGLMSCFAFANAQAPKTLNASKYLLPSQKILNDYVPPSPVIAPNHTPSPAYYGKVSLPPVKVGETKFDHQSNASVYKRILTYPGNKISVIWTTASDGPPDYPSRGTGYNTFDGTSWGAISTTRIEQERTGYPNFGYSSLMGKEIVFAHKIDAAGKSGGLLFSNNLAIGSGTWTGQTVLDTPSVTTHPAAIWARTAISGNYIHVIANYTVPTTSQPDSVIMSGVREPTVYSRYNIVTTAWEVKNMTLPGYDGTRWRDGAADGYSIDAIGSNVAIVMGGITNDITLWKSTDDGHTWSQTIIDSFPFPAYNEKDPFPAAHLNDTLLVCDGSVNLKLDSTGKAHCYWGTVRILWNQTNAALGLLLGTNGINYWYEGRPDSIKEQIGYSPDVDGDGLYNPGKIDNTSRYGNAGCSTMPYTTVDGAGRIFLVYSGVTENDLDGGGYGYRDVYCVYSSDNGSTWSTPRNLTAYLGGSEQMFASLPQTISGTLQMTYMQSSSVGFYDANNNSGKQGPFDIMYFAPPIADVIANTVGISEVKNDVFSMDQNFPNPFRGVTSIPVKLKMNTDVTIQVISVVGQTVYTHTFEKANSGLNNFQLDLNNLNSGVYFYTVEANGYKTTKRMMVE